MATDDTCGCLHLQLLAIFGFAPLSQLGVVVKDTMREPPAPLQHAWVKLQQPGNNITLQDDKKIGVKIQALQFTRMSKAAGTHEGTCSVRVEK